MTKKYATKVREAEDDKRGEITANADDVRRLAVLEPRLITAHEAAQHRYEDVRREIGTLSDRYGPGDLTDAAANVEHRGLQVKGCARLLDAAKRKKISTDVEVAESLARLVQGIFVNTSTVSTFVSSSAVPAISERPLLEARQTSPTGWNADGSISGIVELTYYRTPGDRPLTTDLLREAAAELNVVLSVGMVRDEGDHDRARVSVQSAPVAMPVIETVSPYAPGLLGQTLASDLARDFGDEIEGLSHGNVTDPFIESSHVVVCPFGVQTEGEEINGDGIRRTVVTGTLAARVKRDLGDYSVFDAASALAEKRTGMFVRDLGSVEAFTFEWDRRSAELDQEATATVTRSTGLREHRGSDDEHRFGIAVALPFRAILVSRVTRQDFDTEDTEDAA